MAEEKKEKATQEAKKTTERSEEVPQSGREKKAEQAQPKQEPEKKAESKRPKEVLSEGEGKSDIQLSKKMQDIMSSIEGMTVLELSNLVKALEEKFGVTAAQPVIAAGMAGATAPGAAPAEEKSTFTIVLAGIGSNKIQVIKEIRAITTLGLKEAKDLVESAPKPVKEGATKEEAEEIKKKLEAAGAKVELK